MELIVIRETDNVAVDPESGQKYARREIKKGEAVIKYGRPIGAATAEIPAGAHVHTHNLKTALTGETALAYTPEKTDLQPLPPAEIMAYARANGQIGIRNDIWIIPTVGCVNNIAAKLIRDFC